MGGSYHRDPREAEQVRIDLYLKEQKLICERLYKQFTKQA